MIQTTHNQYSVDAMIRVVLDTSIPPVHTRYERYAIKDTTAVLQHDTLEYIHREGTRCAD